MTSTGETEKMIVIGGGIGPMAGVALQQKVIEETLTDGSDQDHLELIHLSRSPIIGDRSDFLAGKEVADPIGGMLRVLRMAAAGLETEGREAVAGIPCNTFHSPAIFDPFAERLSSELPSIRLLNMIEETVESLTYRLPEIRRIGLLSTNGTRRSAVYRHILESRGIELLEIPGAEQDALHEAIYNRSWGIKALSRAGDEAERRVSRCAETLCEAGAEAIILGCTELPLALPEGLHYGVLHIDPIRALARALVREAAVEKLRPLP